MTTRNIVPRTTEEGQLGTTSKKWSKGYFKELFMGSTPAKCSVEGHTHAQADVTNLVSALAGKASTAAATTSAAGLVELATDAEFDTGTDTERYASVAQVRQMRNGWKNLIVNGGFDVWQRGTTIAVTTTAYVADRWLANNATVTREAFPVGQTDVPNNPRFFLRRTVSNAMSQIVYRIEGVERLSGETVTLSLWIRSSTSLGAITLSCSQVFGTGGSDAASATIVSGNIPALSANIWTRAVVVISFPSIAGKTIGTNDYSQILIRHDNCSVGATLDIAQAQLELGSCATPFERRPDGLELALCRRYCRIFAVNVPATATPISIPIDMRAIPTITGGGTGFSSTGTTADTLICSQTTGAVQTLTLSAEL